MLAVLFASSRWGIGILADSTVYVGAARLLLSTGQLQALDPQGRAIPWIHTAPFFPATLAAAAALLRIDPVVAAQGLCAICFGITVGLVGWVGWRWLGSARFGVLAALLTLIATPMVDIYTAALSEPLYLVLALGALVLLAHYLESPNRKLLVAAAVLSALAILTRYAGAALLGGEGLVLLFLPRNRPWTIRIRDLSLFSFLAGAPIALWLIRNRLATGRSTTATVSLGHLSGSLATLSGDVPAGSGSSGPLLGGVPAYFSWLFPGSLPSSIRIAATLSMIALLAAALRYASRAHREAPRPSFPADPGSSLMAVLLAFIGWHLGLIVMARSFLYSDIVMDDRNLLPTLGPLLLLVLWSLKKTSESGRMRLAWIPAALILTAFAATNAPRSVSHLLKTAKEGRGYARAAWERSPVLQKLKALPPNIPVYATLPSAVRYLTGIPARLLPIAYDPRGGVANSDYKNELEEMRRQASDSGIAVAFVGGNAGRSQSAGEIQNSLGLILAAQDSIGSLVWSPSLSRPR